MNREKLLEDLAAPFTAAGNLQSAELVSIALKLIWDGIDGLSKLGHRYALTPYVPGTGQEWPKMMYTDSDAQVFASAADVPKDGGWRDTPVAPAKAQRDGGKK